MTYDLGAILRQIKPEKIRTQIEADHIGKPENRLDAETALGALVLDTMVYIEMAGGRVDETTRAILRSSLQHHSIVALTELAQGLAAANPDRPDYKRVRLYYLDLIKAVPRSRLLLPDADVWMRAGVIAGLLSRTQNFQPHQRQALHADALIFLSATKAGLPLVTRNVRDFALIRHIHGAGRIVPF